MSTYKAYVEHFSDPTTATSIFLKETIAALHPNDTLTTTQDRHFDPQRFQREFRDGKVTQHAAELQIRLPQSLDLQRVEGSPSASHLAYEAPRRRRDGPGKLVEQYDFAEFSMQWGDSRLVAFVVKWWEQGCGFMTQWHLLGPEEVAREVVHQICTWCAATKGTILVFDRGSWRNDATLYKAVQSASWDDVILSEQLKADIRRDYTSFFQSEAIYKGLQVPWKRGVILLGPPGNGKTITMKAIMKDVDVPSLYVKSLKNPNGEEFGIRQIFSRARSEAPCVLILEDLDSMITDANRSFFLNEVDGLEDNDGILLIGTTNHFEKLDSALSNRPSRFDRKYVFENPSPSERRQYAQYWQRKASSNPDLEFPDELLDQVEKEADGFSFAYLKEVFVSALLIMASNRDRDSAKTNSQSSVTFSQAVLDQIKYLKDQLAAGNDVSMAASWINGPNGAANGDRLLVGRMMRGFHAEMAA